MENNCNVGVSMTKCFWCGKETGIRIYEKDSDSEDVKYIFGGYEPCDECKAKMEKGFTIIEAEEHPLVSAQPEIQKGVYPTGSLWVIDREAAAKVFSPEVVKKDTVFISKDIAKEIGLYGEEE